MDTMTQTELQGLTQTHQQPAVTIFGETRPGGSEEDVYRFKEQLREAQRQLKAAGFADEEAEAILKPARTYLEPEFAIWWRDAGQGIAAFLAPGFARLFRLPVRFTPQVTVGPRFQVMPLMPWISNDGNFFVLALSQGHARLLEATARSVRRLELPGVSTMAESRPAHDRDEPLNLHSHPASIGRAMTAVFHGQGVGIDDHKDELLHYCQSLDGVVRKAVSDGHAPLVLATVEFLAAIYRKASHHANLCPEIVKGNPDRVSDESLRDRAWQLIGPTFRGPAENAVDRYRQLAGTGRTTDQVAELIPAVRRGELETLLVTNSNDHWGRYDPATDQVEEWSAYKPGDEELVNLAVNYAFKKQRTVHVVEPAAINGKPMAGLYFAPMSKHGK